MHSKLLQSLALKWTIVRQAPLPTEFSRQEYWNGLTFCSRGLPNSGIEPASLTSLALAGSFFTTTATREAREDTGKSVLNSLKVGGHFCILYILDLI